MSEAFLGEIKIIAFNFAPRGWALCNGQLLPINQNQALFSLLGTTYGGNGQTTFALPDLRGRIPVHVGIGYTLGQSSGEENHTLNFPEMPAHTHPVFASTHAADLVNPSGNLWATTGSFTAFAAAPNETMAPQSIGAVGGSQPHPNLPPYLTVNFAICMVGIFPSRT